MEKKCFQRVRVCCGVLSKDQALDSSPLQYLGRRDTCVCFSREGDATQDGRDAENCKQERYP
jgi:hypothetical protein